MRKYEEVRQPEHGLQSRRVFTWTAGPEDAGRPVRDIILYKWKLVSHDVARAKYETDHGITVNGETVFVDRRLREGDTLRVVLTDCAPEKIVPTDEPIEIVYEDEDLICLNKPAGVVVHPSHGHFADSLANRLAFYFQKKNEPHEIRTVGRLDKDTMIRRRRASEGKYIMPSVRGFLMRRRGSLRFRSSGNLPESRSGL